MSNFPDIEAFLMTLFAVDGVQTGTRTPAKLEGNMPFVRIMRIGGGDDGITDTARLGIDCFGANRDAARNLAESIRQTFSNASKGFPIFGEGCVIDNATTNTAPMFVDWGNPNVHRYYAAYTVLMRRIRSA